MTDKLKPCPFCGGEADVLEASGFFDSPGIDGMTVARCRSCKAKTNPRKSAEETAKAWNTRADAFKQPEGTFLMPIPDKQLAYSEGEFDPENGRFVMSFEFVEDEIKRYNGLLDEKLLDAICECRGYVRERTCFIEYDECGENEIYTPRCSECGDRIVFSVSFCPNCGAKVVK